MATPCKECGYPLNGTESSCPECGCPTEFEVSSSNAQTKTTQTDNWDYSQYRSGIFSQWYFPCPDKDKADSYDTLNDILLLFNLLFRAVWSLFWPLALIWVVYYLFVLIVGASAPRDAAVIIVVTQIVLIFVSVYIAFANLIPKTMHKFWVPFHRTWRRINKRYWVNMHKAIESDNVNIV